MWRKRVLVWLFICFSGFMLLLGRLVQVQLFAAENFSKHHINLLEASVQQRSQEMVLDHGRGNFHDRNGRPIAYEKKAVLILFPFLEKMEWDAERVAKIVDAPRTELIAAVAKSKQPFAFRSPEPLILTNHQMDRINSLKIPGVFAVEQKYPLEKVPAGQLIGITGENTAELRQRYPGKDLSPQTLIGVSGLEASFDEFLLPEGKSKLVFHVDGDGGPLFGINVKYVDPANPFYPVNIKTTLDIELQKRAEELADQHGIIKGGLVLLDIETNSVLAMVSRPNISQQDPYNQNGITNMMLKEQIMGSVFKTVIAAAAIDYELDNPSRTFDCSKKINGEPDKTYEHGTLNFIDSFARSCNYTFGELAKELSDIDPNLIEEYAEKLSLTGPVGWQGSVYHFDDFKQMADEDIGRVFRKDQERTDKNFVALSGIGQHEVRATPLAVASMMAVIARGGQKEMVRAVSEIEYKNGTVMAEFAQAPLKGEEIAPYTAMKLQQLLREVVINENGTGRWFNDLPYEVAGKSGTAETGIFDHEQQLHNKWFAGYFPYHDPKYALVTVNLDVRSDQGGINPFFADMVKAVHDYNLKQ
ncbi:MULTISPECIES: peptidoglycan D,D-transpeptidase FtsI family protein [Bacillus]|uniref:peptidoglycan D,D-transpeptidase FtsI family protein n=1 Tax=Bacillus TaxID=1386 RepID=UPI000C77AF20|nr:MULTISPECIES: penicillin-binding transpeptidase domain-containing protein [Bacillus]PLR87685.1 penicillin-binding protein [Bacillus sp. V33-4]RSK43896.1 penicillin-binding protein 2 [Bacillus canaveralius]